MNDRDDDLGLKELEARLKQARLSTDRRNGDGPENSRGPARGVGFAARIGTDILAALVVGLGLGWFLDRWLGTAPFAMMVFLYLVRRPAYAMPIAWPTAQWARSTRKRRRTGRQGP
ncbi:AtpZ/AtpI family protein [Tistrella bauzanensis]